MKNLTPHSIVVRLPDGSEKAFPPSGEVAKVGTIEAETVFVEGIPTIFRDFGGIQLPDIVFSSSEPFLVSSLVLEAAKQQNHPDMNRMLAPDTGPTAIREGGQVKAVTRLVRA
jgi:hypothetical protein